MDVKRVLIGGLVASVVMGMAEMVLEQFLGGNGFWSAPVYIAASLLRDYQSVGAPVPFELLPVAVGLMGHMMNSVVLGAVFAAVTPRFAGSPTTLVGLGALWGVVVLLMMWLVVLPIVNPVMLNLSFGVFAVSHLMWGIVIGITVAAARTSGAQWRGAFA